MKRLLSVERGAQSGGKRSVPVVIHRGSLGSARERMRCTAGFTLVELMIVVAIVAILAAIAYPSYTQHVIKARRTAGKACLSEYANYMERYYTTNLRYDKSAATPAEVNTLPVLDCASTAQTGNYYGWNLDVVGASIYTVSATPQGAQLADTQCGKLTLNQAGTRTPVGNSPPCW